MIIWLLWVLKVRSTNLPTLYAFTQKVEWFGHFMGFWVQSKGLPPSAWSPNPPPRYLQKLLYHIQTNTICWTLRHIGKAHATWFGQLVLVVASGLPPYLKWRRENTGSTSSQWNCRDMVVWGCWTWSRQVENFIQHSLESLDWRDRP